MEPINYVKRTNYILNCIISLLLVLYILYTLYNIMIIFHKENTISNQNIKILFIFILILSFLSTGIYTSIDSFIKNKEQQEQEQEQEQEWKIYYSYSISLIVGLIMSSFIFWPIKEKINIFKDYSKKQLSFYLANLSIGVYLLSTAIILFVKEA